MALHVMDEVSAVQGTTVPQGLSDRHQHPGSHQITERKLPKQCMNICNLYPKKTDKML